MLCSRLIKRVFRKGRLDVVDAHGTCTNSVRMTVRRSLLFGFTTSPCIGGFTATRTFILAKLTWTAP